jgi:hypothetical protein
MTEIQASRPIVRETATYYRGRPLVVELHPGYISVREKGKRTAYALDYGRIFDRAVKLAVEAARAEKRAAKRKTANR